MTHDELRELARLLGKLHTDLDEELSGNTLGSKEERQRACGTIDAMQGVNRVRVTVLKVLSDSGY